jgi:signal transduction histidine kinase/DNA-binding response OmpR family regulator
MPFLEFLEERESQPLSLPFEHYLRDPKGQLTLETPVKSLDQGLIWLRLRLRRAAGFTQTLCVVEDLSGQKLRESSLVSAKNEAEAAANTRSQFVANMSHEIRTPIQTILGMIELLEDTKLDREQEEYARQARFAVDVLLSLVNDILDFSKIEADKLELESIDFSLRSCVEQSCDMIALECHKKGLEMIVDVADDLPPIVRGDPTRLRQIIVNLVKNAVKFTKAGDVFVQARKTRLKDGRDALRLEVADTGIGIPKNQREKLFSSFFQVDASHSRMYGGTGLGLAISRRLVESMGGSIGMRANEPEGSVFFFDLPLTVAREISPSKHPALTGSVLVVDDKLASRLVICRLATELGLNVETASSGLEALERLERRSGECKHFDLCVVDQFMPIMDGWRLAAEISQREKICQPRLILMSPEGSIGPDAKMKLLNWFCDYVTKPVKREPFRQALARALGQADEADELEELDSEERLPGKAGARVLVADDHVVNQELFKTILERAGNEVSVANDGKQALELCAVKDFDIVFMDIQMPEMDGFEATRALRAKGATMPIIAVTASAERRDRERCLECGMDDILTKPFGRADIVAMTEYWLKHAWAEAEPQEAEQGSLDFPCDPSIFDFHAAVDIFLGNKQTVISLLGKFINRTKKSIQSIDEAVLANDLESVAREAHSIKGSAWNICAKPLGDAAAELERLAKDGVTEGMEERIGILRGSFFDFAQQAQYYVTASYQ